MPNLTRIWRWWFLSTAVIVLSSCQERTLSPSEALAESARLSAEGRPLEAITVLETALGRSPEDPGIVEALAFAHDATGEHELAGLYFSQLADSPGQEPEYYLLAAQAFFLGSNENAAADLYRRYLTRMPRHRSVWIQLASLLQSMERTSEAADAYLEAYQIEQDTETALQLGRLHLTLGQASSARVWFENALAKGGREGESLMGLVAACQQTGQSRDASRYAARLREEHPEVQDQWPPPPLEMAGIVASEPPGTDPVSSLANLVLTAMGKTPPRPPAESAGESPGQTSAAIEPSPAPVEPAAMATAEQTNLAVTQEATAGLNPPAPIPTVGQSEPPPETEPAPQEGVASRPAPSAASENAMAAEPELTMPRVVDAVDQAIDRPAEPLDRARAAALSGDWPAAIAGYRQVLLNNDREAQVWRELSAAYLQVNDNAWAEATALEAMRRAPNDPAVWNHYLRVARTGQSGPVYLNEVLRAHQRFPAEPAFTLELARAYWAIARNARNAGFLYREFLEKAPADHPDRAAAEAESDRLPK